MKNLRYKILKSQLTFDEALQDIVERLPQRVVRCSLFVEAKQNSEYAAKKEAIKLALRAKYGAQMPTFSVIAQKPLSAVLAVDYCHAVTGKVSYHGNYIVIESDQAREIVISGLCGDTESSITEQSRAAFEQLAHILSIYGAQFSDIIRQWNYIERITHMDNSSQHYQEFNDVRSDYYSSCEWPMGYPAATGIGASAGGVVIDAYVIMAKSPSLQIRPIDNDLQIAAHVYSKGVLHGELTRKTTPKFERAKSVSTPNSNRLYISGTAAILAEQSLEGVGFEKQIDTTMKNIEHLLSSYSFEKYGVRAGVATLEMMRVYIKSADDIELAIRYMEQYYVHVPAIYCMADVCREELLVEIEGIALRNN